MTEAEKAKFILEDYIKKVIVPCGNIPTELIKAEQWFNNEFLKRQNDFINRYETNSMSQFVKKLAVLYGDVVEKEYNYLFTPGSTKQE